MNDLSPSPPYDHCSVMSIHLLLLRGGGCRRRRHEVKSRLMISWNHRKLNTSPATLEDKEALKKFLTNPPVKKIDLHFPLGLEVTARNLKGVTVKDALDAIYKQFKKKVCQPSDVRDRKRLISASN